MLKVNFDPSLVKMLREVYYLNVMNSFDNLHEEVPCVDIPMGAQSLFAQRDVFRAQVLKLDYISTTYNNFKASLRPHDELPLIKKELADFEQCMQRGLT